MRFIYLLFFFLVSQIADGQVFSFDFKVSKERRLLDQALDLNKAQVQQVEAILTKSKRMAKEGLVVSERKEVSEFLKEAALYYGMHKTINQILEEGQKEKHKNLIVPKDVFFENYINSAHGKLLNKGEMSQLINAWKLL